MIRAAPIAEPPARQFLLDLLPPPAPSFDNFITGDNAETVVALHEWLADPDAPTCFLLWGERHSGRRHLLAASGLPVYDAAAANLAATLQAETAADLALADIDRCDAPAQSALFNAFNQRRLTGGRLLVSSLQPPAALALREDLRTRLGSGLVYRLATLSDADKAAALEARAQALGLALPPGAIDTLFRRSARDLGTLTAVIDALNRYTLEHRRQVTLPLLRQLLDLENPTETP